MNLKYADDTVLVARSKEKLLVFLDRFNNLSLEYRFCVNNTKTKIMIVERKHNFPSKLCISKFEVVDKFTYLGALINNQGDCKAKIRRRIQLRRVTMCQLTKVWKNLNVDMFEM